jgi:hypothetical protein
MLEAKIAGSKGQLVVEDMHSGSFSKREALSPRHSLRVRSSSISWHAAGCSSVLRCVCGCGCHAQSLVLLSINSTHTSLPAAPSRNYLSIS